MRPNPCSKLPQSRTSIDRQLRSCSLLHPSGTSVDLNPVVVPSEKPCDPAFCALAQSSMMLPKIAIWELVPTDCEGLPQRKGRSCKMPGSCLDLSRSWKGCLTSPPRKKALGLNLAETVETLSQLDPTCPTVVVVSGDPLFFGLARYLCEKLGKERFEVLPHVSSMQCLCPGQGKLGRRLPGTLQSSPWPKLWIGFAPRKRLDFSVPMRLAPGN